MDEVITKVIRIVFYAMYAVMIACFVFIWYRYLRIKYPRPKTIEAWLSAAESGDVKAQLKLADHYFFRRDPAQTQWYKMAAEHGSDYAQVNMAYRSQDSSEVFHWAKMAADQNYPQGLALLGICYAKGIGVERNASEARRYFSLAYKKVNSKQKRLIRKHLKEIEWLS